MMSLLRSNRSNRLPSLHLTLGIAAVAALLLAPSLATAQESCTIMSHRATVMPAGEGCHIIQNEALIGSPTTDARVAVIADNLECGQLEIDRWSNARRAALQACAAATDDVGLKISETLAVTGHRDFFVSVLHTSAGDVGGLGPWATADVKTYDLSTGAPIVLADMLPDDHSTLIENARRGLEASPHAADYLFDPDAFVLTSLDGEPAVTFSFPGAVPATQGKTLDMTLYVPLGATVRDLAPLPGADTRHPAVHPMPARERVRKAACIRAGGGNAC